MRACVYTMFCVYTIGSPGKHVVAAANVER